MRHSIDALQDEKLVDKTTVISKKCLEQHISSTHPRLLVTVGIHVARRQRL